MRLLLPTLLVFLIWLAKPAFAGPYAYQITTGSTLSIFKTRGLTEAGSIGLPGPIQFFAATPNGSSVFMATDCCADPFGSFWGTAQASLTGRRLVKTLKYPNSDESGPMVVSPDGTKVYISSAANSAITVVDVASGSVIQTISNPAANGDYTSDLYISADGTTLYAALAVIFDCSGCDAVKTSPTPFITTINASTGNIESQIPVSGVGAIAVTSDGAYAYYTGGLFGLPGDNIAKLDLKTGVTVATIPGETSTLRLSSDGSELYAGYTAISVISTETNSLLGQIPLANAGTISSIAIDPSTTTGYAAYSDSTGLGYLEVFNGTAQTVTSTIQLAGTPGLISLSANSADLYVGLTSPTLISVISTTLGKVTGSIETQFPDSIALSPGNAVLYAIQGQSYSTENSLVAIDASTFRHLGTASITGRQTSGPLLVSPDGTKLYVGTISQTGVGPQDLEVLNSETLTVQSVLPITSYDSAVLSKDGNYLYFLSNASSASVDVNKFDLGANQLVATLTLPNTPSNALVISPSGETLYVGLGLSTGGSIAAVSTSALTLTSILPYCGASLAISPSGGTVYSTGCSTTALSSTPIYQIKARTGALEKTFNVDIQAASLAITADGQSLYVPGFILQPLTPGVVALNVVTGATSFIPSLSFNVITLAN